MKNSIIIILLITLLQSCSSDGISNDKIIGKWVVIESYESGVQVDLDCDQYFYIEFKTNNNLVGDYLDYDSTPEACKYVDFVLNKWRKRNGQYETYLHTNDVNSVISFDGEYLVRDLNYLHKRYVYARLN